MKYRAIAPALIAVLLGTAVPVFSAEPSANTSGAATDPSTTTVAGAGDVAHGKQIFTRYCAVCHGANGSGGLGPSLKKVESRLSGQQIAHQITDPRAAMPRFYPTPLTTDDVRDVVSYVMTL